MTYGLKAASWIDELLRSLERIDTLRTRALAAQLFGGVGTMAGFGDSAPALLERFAERLGLVKPDVGWHVARDRVAEYTSTLAMVAATMARIADELRTLSRPEFGELELPWYHGKVGSSTMPHKRNPEECQQVVVLARLAAAQVPVAMQAMVVEHERDSRALRLEWAFVADVSHHCLAAVAILEPILAALGVEADRMADNVQRTAELMATEAVMLALAEHIGKPRAYEQVYDRAQNAISSGEALRERLAAIPDVQTHMSAAELDAIFDPRRYVGQSRELVEAVSARASERLRRSATR
jgi:adenylosuccinate lyase